MTGSNIGFHNIDRRIGEASKGLESLDKGKITPTQARALKAMQGNVQAVRKEIDELRRQILGKTVKERAGDLSKKIRDIYSRIIRSKAFQGLKTAGGAVGKGIAKGATTAAKGVKGGAVFTGKQIAKGAKKVAKKVSDKIDEMKIEKQVKKEFKREIKARLAKLDDMNNKLDDLLRGIDLDDEFEYVDDRRKVQKEDEDDDDELFHDATDEEYFDIR